VISKDRKVVVSHEPWFSSVISLDPKGEKIAKEREKENNIFLLNYSEIKKFDVGSIGNAGFPEQKPMKVIKPLLSDVFTALDKFTKEKNLPLVRYNIEIKTEVNGDSKFHPEIPEFAALVVKEITGHKMSERVKVQSFDVRPLQEIRKTNPSLKLALLVCIAMLLTLNSFSQKRSAGYFGGGLSLIVPRNAGQSVSIFPALTATVGFKFFQGGDF